MATLLCTVRDCHLPLVGEERRLVCARGHSYDVARSGYINLLQPQDRRSSKPGDTAAAVAARRRFLDRGFGAALVEAIVEALPLTAADAVLDAGCGEGHHLAAIRDRFGCAAYGVDISVAAIDAAARRHPQVEWIVANADRFVPFADSSFHAVCSITARMNPPEFRRVLNDDGTLLVVLPAPDDLLELREAILGERVMRDRTAHAITEFSPLFSLRNRERISTVAHLDHGAIEDVMTSSYRALRHSERARMEAVSELKVTLSRDLLLFRCSE